MGLLMRFAFLGLPAPYIHLLHTHSHIAFLGWVYPTLLILLINFFLDKVTILKYKFNLQILVTHLLILAMFLSFLAQGYGFYSILSSSFFQLANYWFIFSFFKALKQSPEKHLSPVALFFLKIALWALFVSTIGPWAVGIIKAIGLGDSNWSKMAIYFYLHFQYNGWIIFALFALFFRPIEYKLTEKEVRNAKRFLVYMAYALVPGYFLSILGMYKNSWVYSFAAISAILQIQAIFIFVRIIFSKPKNILKTFNAPLINIIAGVVLLALSMKTVLQLLSIIPDLSDLAFSNHNIIIAFIHLTMIGIVSSFILVVLAQKNILFLNSFFPKAGLLLFMIGFIATEVILGFQFSGWPVFLDTKILAAFTFCLALGVVFIFRGFFITDKNN